MGEKLERYIQNAPRPLNAGFNPIVKALLEAWAVSDEDLVTQIQNTKDQLFVPTASGTWLDRLGSSVGVSRPTSLGMSDGDFQKLIPNLSLKPKQIRKIFYDTMDVFWGPLFSRANITSLNGAPFNVIVGDTLYVKIDGNTTEQVKVFAGQIATPGAATAEEIVAILSKLKRATPSVIEDQTSGIKYVNIRTNTPGSRGSVQILASSIVGGAKIDFSLDEIDILKLDQRTVVYEINPRELIIEIPAAVPSLRRTLRGSHHFHADATVSSPQPTSNFVWAGSFFYEPSGPAYTVTGKKATLQDNLQTGQVYTKITVADSSQIPNSTGFLIFDFGLETEEAPVPYVSVPNGNTIFLDPSYKFKKDHVSGTSLNFISQKAAYSPKITGEDLAIYMTSPVQARDIVQALLLKLAAAGIIVTFKILLPTYKYLILNPYEYYELIVPDNT